MNILDSIQANLIDESSVIDIVEEEQKEAKRQERIDGCGSWVHRCNPSTGGYKSFQLKCGYWRECPDCFHDRVIQFEARYVACLNSGETRIIMGNRKTIRKLRRLGIEYWAIPQEDGVVIVHEGSEVFGPEIEPDWEAIANTPEHTRYSGNLGKPEKEEEEYEVRFTIPVRQFSIQPGKVPVAQMISEASARTDDLNPALDEDELRWAVWTKSNVLREVVLEMGGVILTESIVLVCVTDKSYKPWNVMNKTTTEMPEKIPIPALEMTQAGFSELWTR